MRPARGALRAVLLVAVVAAVAVLTPGRAFAWPGGYGSGEYVALGDSYTAGPVIPNQTGQPAGCQRSDHNYPSLVRRHLRSWVFRDVSCSGATTNDMTRPQAVRGGSNPPQLNALTSTTTLVTLGIGGNDIGFADIVANCALRSSEKLSGAACKDYYERFGDDQIYRRIDATAPKVAQVLAEIAKRAPRAKVLVVGYPTILPDSGPGCYPVVPFSPGDVAYLRSVERRLNAMLAAQAGMAGAEFVDTYQSSIGHDICQPPGRKWVEGLLPTSQAAPLHPNALGMRNSAQDVLRTLNTRTLTGA